MDGLTYLTEIIEPTLKEYANERTSVRRAYLACVAVYHIIDHLAAGGRPEGIRAKIRKECPSFIVVERVAHAFKHGQTGHPDNIVKPLTAEEVITRPPALFGKAVFGLSRFGDSWGGVTLAGAENVDLLAELGLAQYHFQKMLRPDFG